MQQSGYPSPIPTPWASAATSSYINVIPTAPNSSNPDLASFQQGFPSGTFGAAGQAPYGQDFNGILNQVTAGLQYAQAGSVPLYNASFATAISGYPKGALLASTTLGSFWVNQVDGNTTNPDSSGSNWLSLFAGLAPIASPSFTGTPLTPTPAAGTNNTQIANTAWTKSNFAAINGSASEAFNVAAGAGTEAPQFQQVNPGRLINVQVFTSSGTYTPAAGTNKVIAEIVGGGGGGGGAPATSSTQQAQAEGGYSGAYQKIEFISGFSGAAITIGAAGVGGAAGSNHGTNGGTSSFGSLASSPGGGGGRGGIASPSTSQSSPAVVGAIGTNTSGTVLVSLPQRTGAGIIVFGTSFEACFGGAGGSSPLGGGGGAVSENAGNSATGYGGGGGGAGQTAGNAGASGGNGSPGIVIIREYS